MAGQSTVDMWWKEFHNNPAFFFFFGIRIVKENVEVSRYASIVENYREKKREERMSLGHKKKEQERREREEVERHKRRL